MVNGFPIIYHQLKAIPSWADIHLVLGFKANEIVQWFEGSDGKQFKNVTIHLNMDYEHTGPAHSVRIGMKHNTNESIIILDGDVIPERKRFKELISSNGNTIGIRKRGSQTPSPAAIIYPGSERIERFIESHSQKFVYEWACVCKISQKFIETNEYYIYQSLDRFFPAYTKLVDFPEIDTQEDIKGAEKWLSTIET
jgi:hypothetical protein